MNHERKTGSPSRKGRNSGRPPGMPRVLYHMVSSPNGSSGTAQELQAAKEKKARQVELAQSRLAAYYGLRAQGISATEARLELARVGKPPSQPELPPKRRSRKGKNSLV